MKSRKHLKLPACLPACLPLALALAGLGNPALAQSVVLVDTPSFTTTQETLPVIAEDLLDIVSSGTRGAIERSGKQGKGKIEVDKNKEKTNSAIVVTNDGAGGKIEEPAKNRSTNGEKKEKEDDTSVVMISGKPAVGGNVSCGNACDVENAMKNLVPSLNKNKETAQKAMDALRANKVELKSSIESVKTIKSEMGDKIVLATQRMKLAVSAQASVKKGMEKLQEKAAAGGDEKAIAAEIENLSSESEFWQNKINEEKDRIRVYKNTVSSSEEFLEKYQKSLAETDQKIADTEKAIAAAIATADAVAKLLDPTTGTAEERDAKLNTLGGSIYASTNAVLLNDHRMLAVVQAHMPGQMAQPVLAASNGNTPLGTALRSPSTRTWASGWGYDAKLSGSNKGEDLHHKGSGLTVGGDVRVNDALTLGAMLGYEDGKVTNNEVASTHTNVTSYSLGSYASVNAGSGVTVSGGLLYSKLDLNTARDLAKLGLAGDAKAKYKGSKVQAFADVARALEVGEAATVTPYLGLSHTWLRTDAAKERGALAAPLLLDVKAQQDSALLSTLGVRASYRLPTATPVSLTANVGWTHAFGKSALKTSNHFAGADARMSVEGTRLDRDHALVGVGVEAQITPRATLTLGYNGQFGSHDTSHAGNVLFKLRF